MKQEAISNQTISSRRRRRRRKKLIRKIILLFFFLILISCTLMFLMIFVFRNNRFPVPFREVDIVLDAGHGGKDCGTNHKDLFEKDITLAIAEKTKNLLSEEGYKVSLTRESDKFVELADRALFANQRKAKIFVSLHCNSSEDGSGNGIETYYAEAKEEGSKALAESIQKSLIDATKARDREVKTADYAVILGTDMPAALVEVGFFTDEKERALLQTEEYQQKLAKGITEGIILFDIENDLKKITEY